MEFGSSQTDHDFTVYIVHQSHGKPRFGKSRLAPSTTRNAQGGIP
jgi:hypothetical protein